MRRGRKKWLSSFFNIGMIILISFSPKNMTGQNAVPIDDYFDDMSDWTAFSLSGQRGTYSYENNRLVLTSGSGSSEYGLYHSKPISGNYYVEATFGADDAVALALIRSHRGVPDFENYVMVTVNNRSGKIYFNQYDKQNGIQNVHDKFNLVPDSDFEIRLDGTVFSVPFTGTRKKIRIAHDNLANVFRFLVGTRLNKDGFISRDWLEVSPIYSWMESGQEMHVALMVRNERNTGTKTATYSNVKVVQTPEEDQNDSKTGFQAVAREFNWSGWNGEAVVVSFGDEFKFSDSNKKLVFWDRANNAPLWLLNNQLMHGWQFGERKGGGFDGGAAEAMSDRQRHGQELEIVENNDVRKVIRWKQIPYYPNYNYPGEGSGGSDLPYFEEYWTMYPDGTGTRRFVDVPKLDGSNWGWWPEFIEPMGIGGSLIPHAGVYSSSPAFTIRNMEGDVHNFHPPQGKYAWDNKILGYDQLIMSAHYENEPDVFLVYNNDRSHATNDRFQLEGSVSWHRPNYRFSHWPVGRQPYGRNTVDVKLKSFSYHWFDATHNAYGSFGRYGLGQGWTTNYKVNSDGRKYRDYIMLVGLNEPNDYATLRKKTQTWLEPGIVVSDNPKINYQRVNYAEKVMQFRAEQGESDWTFSVSPSRNKNILNPVFKCNNWSGSENVIVRVNGDAISGFRSALIDNQLLVWIEGEFSKKTSFEIFPSGQVNITNNDVGAIYSSLKLDSQLADLLWQAYGVADAYAHDFAAFTQSGMFDYKISTASEVEGWIVTIHEDGTIALTPGRVADQFSTGKTMRGTYVFDRALLDADGDGRMNYTFDLAANFTPEQLSHPLSIIGQIGRTLDGNMVEAYDTSGGILFPAPGQSYALVPTADHPLIAASVGVTLDSPLGRVGPAPGPTRVTLASASPTAAIRYTLDGSLPDETSPLYDGPFLLTRSAVLRAVAFVRGLEPSLVMEAFVEAHFDFAAWTRWHGLKGAAAAPDADLHGRGLANLLAYAFGVPTSGPIEDPALPIPGNERTWMSVIPYEPDGRPLVIRFPVRRDAPEILYEVLFGPSPAGPWNPAEITLDIHDHHWAEGTAEDPRPQGPTRFGKVRVAK